MTSSQWWKPPTRVLLAGGPVLLAALLLGCGGGNSDPATVRRVGAADGSRSLDPGDAKKKREEEPQKEEQPDTADPPELRDKAIPADVLFDVVERTIDPGNERIGPRLNLRVSINKRVSGETLGLIAKKLKAEDKAGCERASMYFFLPGMKLDTARWAVANFKNPLMVKWRDGHTFFFGKGLQVVISGMNVEEETRLRKLPNDPTRKVLGAWLSDRSAEGDSCRLIIFKRAGKTYMETTSVDGRSSTAEITEKAVPDGTRFGETSPVKPKARRQSGEYWLIDKSSNLEIHDNDGLVATAKRIDK